MQCASGKENETNVKNQFYVIYLVCIGVVVRSGAGGE